MAVYLIAALLFPERF
ncbi:potassium-transporting ATPase subunit F [Nocardia gipuzkoensis]